MPLYFFYTMVQKSRKKDQKLKSRGPALTPVFLHESSRIDRCQQHVVSRRQRLKVDSDRPKFSWEPAPS